MTETHVGFPYRVDRRGRTNEVDERDHVRQLIAQVLFTAPGERVNRPDFGSGLTQLLFSPSDTSVAAAAQVAAQTAIHTWLGDLVALDDLNVSAEDGRLRVTVRYSLVRTGVVDVVTFDRGTFAGAGA